MRSEFHCIGQSQQTKTGILKVTPPRTHPISVIHQEDTQDSDAPFLKAPIVTVKETKQTGKGERYAGKV